MFDGIFSRNHLRRGYGGQEERKGRKVFEPRNTLNTRKRRRRMFSRVEHVERVGCGRKKRKGECARLTMLERMW